MRIPPHRIAISPNYTLASFPTPLTLDDKIKIFQDRTLGWQLKIAERCDTGIPHSGFAVLDIVLSYFETISKFHEGYCRTGKSRRHFEKGVYFVFPNLRKKPKKIVNNALNVLWEGARCGLYHDSITDRRITLTDILNVPMRFKPKTSRLTINPNKLVQALKDHLQKYCSQLQNKRNRKLRRNFEKRFDYLASR